MKYLFTLISVALFSTWVNAQCSISYTVDSIPALCAGSCDGAIEFDFTNSGTASAPYNVIFENSLGDIVGSNTFFSESGSYTFSGVCAGIYTVSIQSIFSPACFYQTTIEVTEPTQVMITSINLVHENSGMSNGEITINASGGNPPYSYSINEGDSFQASNNFTNLNAGTYEVVVQDDNGCTADEVVGLGLITSTGCEVVAAVTPQATSCNGVCDGELSFSYENLQMGSPGAPYTVTLEDSDGNIVDIQVFATEIQTLLFDNLCSDTYTITTQGSSCSFIITGTVQSPNPIGLYVNETHPTFGSANGEAQLVAIGDLPPYQYSINGGTSYQASPEFTGLSAGTYTAQVEDNNGCTQDFIFELTDQTTCDLNITAAAGTSPSCFDVCNGTISYLFDDIYANGTYTVSLIKNGNVIQTSQFNSLAGSGTFNNVCSGVYTISITNNLSCSASSTVSLSQPTILQIAGVNTSSSEPDGATGSAEITSGGGTSPLTYSIDGTNYVSGSTFSNLAPAIYTAYVEDANGCTDSFPFVINEISDCSIATNTLPEKTQCPGSCDGAVEITINGDVADTPYYVELIQNGNVQQTAVYTTSIAVASFTGLCEGFYFLRIVGSTGCEIWDATEVGEPQHLDFEVSVQNATTGDNDGSLTIFTSGGVAPYEYSINNQASWSGGSLFSNLTAGEYPVWVKDANGCLSYHMISLPEESTCSSIIEIITTPISCTTDCDATLTCTFNDTGNNPPYIIQLWQGENLLDTSATITTFSGLHTFTDLCDGPYAISVVDANGCADVQEVYIHEPAQMEIIDVIISEPTAGNFDGTVEFIVEGGIAPYEFSINSGANWQEENYFDEVGQGSYVLMVKDINDCYFIHAFTVNEQPGCNIVTSFNLIQPISCYDSCDAIIEYSFFEAANVPPYTVQLIANSGVIESEVYTTNSFNSVWDTLCLGIYTISVTNGNGCTSVMPSLFVTLPPDLYLSGTITNPNPGMSDGAIDLYSIGGTGQHLYSLNGTDYQTQPFFDDFAPGNYLVHVTDENGCKDTLNFTVIENPNCDITVSTLSDDLLACPGDCNGNISFDYTDIGLNAPYAIQLFNDAGSVVGSATGASTSGSGIFSNLCAGNYNIVVSNSAGCQTAPSSVTIAHPDYLQIDEILVHPFDNYYNGSITLNATGGTAPYQFSNNQITWSTTNTWTNLNEGFYVLYIKDANGCEYIHCVVLQDEWVTSVVDQDVDVTVYPNPTQGMVFVSGNEIQTIRVYDASGKLILVPEIVASNGVLLDFTPFNSSTYQLEVVSYSGEIWHNRVVKN